MTAVVITNIVFIALILTTIVGLLAWSVLISAREDAVRPVTRRVTRRHMARTRVFPTTEGLNA